MADLGRAVNWEDVNLARSLRPASGNPLAYLSGATPSNLMPSDPFAPQRVTKNPGIQSAVDSILGRVSALPTDPNVNPNVTRANVKDPATAARITSAGSRFDADVSNTRQSFADFVKNYSAGLAESQKQLGTESASLDSVYDTGPGGLEAKLAAMANARRLAVTTAAQRAMRAAGGRANSARLLGGDSSYLDAQMLSEMGGIGADAAREKADLDRLNLLGVTDARSRLLGTRGNALMNLVQRGLLPVQAGQQLAGNELAQLSGLSNLTNANTFFNLDSPDAMLSRQLGLLSQTSSIDNANNFWRKLYESDGAGALPIGRGGGGRGGFNFPQIDMFDDGSGTYAPAPSSRFGAPQVNRAQEDARARYKAVSGVYPEQDPNFSPELMQWVMQHNDTPRAVNYASNAGISPFLDSNFSEELWRS